MKILNKLSKRELELLDKINIKIEDREYTWSELEKLKENIVINGEISNLEGSNYSTTDIAMEYAYLVDKFIDFENKI